MWATKEQVIGKLLGNKHLRKHGIYSEANCGNIER